MLVVLLCLLAFTCARKDGDAAAASDVLAALGASATAPPVERCLQSFAAAGSSTLSPHLGLRHRFSDEPAAAYVAAMARASGPPMLELLTCVLTVPGAVRRSRRAALAPLLFPVAASMFGTAPEHPFALIAALLEGAGGAALLSPPPIRGDESALHTVLRADWVLLGDATAKVLNPDATASYASFLRAFADTLAKDLPPHTAAWVRGAGARLAATASGAGAAGRTMHASDVQTLAAAISLQLYARVAAAAGASRLDTLLVSRDAFGRTPVHLAAALASPPAVAGERLRLPLPAVDAHTGWLRTVSALSHAEWCAGAWPEAPLALRDAWGHTAAHVEAQMHGWLQRQQSSVMSELQLAESAEQNITRLLLELRPAACWKEELASRPAGEAAAASSSSFAACLVAREHATISFDDCVAAAAALVKDGLRTVARKIAAEATLELLSASDLRRCVHLLPSRPLAAAAPTLSSDANISLQLNAVMAPIGGVPTKSASASTGGWTEPLIQSPSARRALDAAAALHASQLSDAQPALVLPCAIQLFDVDAAPPCVATAGAAPDGSTTVDECDAMSALTDALVRALTAGAPLLIRGLASGSAAARAMWPALDPQRWAIDSFLTRHGSRRFPVGAIPYPDVFGRPQRRQTLADFVLGTLFCNASSQLELPATLLQQLASTPSSALGRRIASLNGGGADAQRALCSEPALSSAQSYIFNRAIQGAESSTVALIEDMPLPPFLSHVFLRRHGEASAGETRTWERAALAPRASHAEPLLSEHPEPPNRQFYMGAAGSGAPAHFHQDAVNVLLHGEKRWLLQPPVAALYSTAAVADYVQALAAGIPGEPPPLMCTQLAGDVLFVPRGWGHAVLNMRTSVGYAIEFASPLQRY